MSLWGNTDTEGDKPTFAADSVGVSVAEAQNQTNRAKGIKTPGWNKITTYTDAQGNVRNKVYTLVAMSSITGDSDQLPPVTVITIDTQPSDTSAVEGETAVFVVEASSVGDGVVSYQWQKSDNAGVTWSNIVGANADTYETGALTVADDDGDQYRVIVSATGGATPVTSDAATLTVTA